MSSLRAAVLDALAGGPKTTRQLAAVVGMPTHALSGRLRRMAAAGGIAAGWEGRRIPHGPAAIRVWSRTHEGKDNG